MLTHLKYGIFLLLYCLNIQSSFAKNEQVAFYGNSFTYYNNNVATHVRTLAKSLLPDKAKGYKFRSNTISSGRLGWHIEGYQKQNSLQKWDIVILQGQSTEPVSMEAKKREYFEDSAIKISEIAHIQGQRIIFFMSWDYPGMPELYGDSKLSNTKKIALAYKNIAKKVNGEVAPIGLAFEYINQYYPNINLYAKDNKHPSQYGTYLSACVLFSTIYQQSPVGGGITEDMNIDKNNAKILQQVAWKIVSEYK